MKSKGRQDDYLSKKFQESVKISDNAGSKKKKAYSVTKPVRPVDTNACAGASGLKNSSSARSKKKQPAPPPAKKSAAKNKKQGPTAGTSTSTTARQTRLLSRKSSTAQSVNGPLAKKEQSNASSASSGRSKKKQSAGSSSAFASSASVKKPNPGAANTSSSGRTKKQRPTSDKSTFTSATKKAPAVAAAISSARENSSTMRGATTTFQGSVSEGKKKIAAVHTPAASKNRGKSSSRKTIAPAENSSEICMTPVNPPVESTRSSKSQIVSDDSSLGDSESNEYYDVNGALLQIHRASSDGDCLLHSLLQENSQRGAMALRFRLADFLLSNEKHYRPIFEEAFNERFEEIVQNVSRQGVYGGQEIIQPFADFSGVTIVVFVRGGNSGSVRQFVPSTDDPNFVSADATGEIRYLLYDNSNHFDFLLPLVEEVEEEESDEDESGDEMGGEDVEEEEESDDDDVEEEESDDDNANSGDGTDEEMNDEEEEERASHANRGHEFYTQVENINNSVQGVPAIGYEDGQSEYAGSGSFEIDEPPIPQAREASSPRGSPVDKLIAAAQSAASKFGGYMPENLNGVFAGGGRRSMRERKQYRPFSPS